MMGVKLGKHFKIKDGKIVKSIVPRDASHAAAMRKGKKQRVVRRAPG